MEIAAATRPARPCGLGCVQAVVKQFCLCLILIWLCPTNRAAAQCSSYPAAYTDTCTNMLGYMTTYNATLSSSWHGAKSSTAFGTELLAANDNIGLTGLLAPDSLSRVELELDDLAKMNVQFVTVAVSFPILYQPFYQYNNDPQDYQTVLTFYQNVMDQIHQRGMKVLIESFVVFPAYVATQGLPNLSQYYSSLSTTEFNAGRAQNATNVAQLLQPDWLNLGSEPDTESELIGLSAEYTPQQWATEISTAVTQMRAAGIHGKPLIGAGCGAWQMNGSTYVQALLSTGIDYFDMHTFSVNMDFLSQGESYIDMAETAGLGAAISEVWDHPLTDAQLQGKSEFGIIDALAAAEPYNAYSFWATQDAQFLGEIIDLAYWKNLYYVSPFESELFVANVDYNQTAGLSGADLTAAETMAEAAALNAGTLSPLGLWYAAAIDSLNAATLSSAWNNGAAPVAPASIVSIYGTNLATVATPASSLPLPTTLAGASATITDASGAQISLPLFFAGPTQINAEIPAGAITGPAVIAINTPSGKVVRSAVALSSVAPALFSADQSGQGVASAQFVANGSNGQQSTINTFTCAAGTCSGVPLDVSSGSTALVLFGTGIENRASLSDVTVTIGTQTLSAFYAGPSIFAGEDQVNVFVPASLAGSGTVNVTVSVAGVASNVVTVMFQ
jgi:uncharacterized protein (TIGR03437 family)